MRKHPSRDRVVQARPRVFSWLLCRVTRCEFTDAHGYIHTLLRVVQRGHAREGFPWPPPPGHVYAAGDAPRRGAVWARD